ncbi:MAG: hypothetical protein FVQ83_05360 [Chloroflexi bacterium]|nr:hypothetical protein [Chloroflexota bacterium]
MLKKFNQNKHSPGKSQKQSEKKVEPNQSLGSSNSTLLPSDNSKNKAEEYISKVREKIDKLVDEYATGNISRKQFKELYGHYQREIKTISDYVVRDPKEWENAATDGKSILIRKQYSAKAEAFAIYDNASGMPIYGLGKFRMDPALLVPMLSSYRSATREVFGGGIQIMQMEGGIWLSFINGKFTTLIALITNEPSSQQQDFLGELHEVFERANKKVLEAPQIKKEDLLFPHELFVEK